MKYIHKKTKTNLYLMGIILSSRKTQKTDIIIVEQINGATNSSQKQTVTSYILIIVATMMVSWL